MAEKTGLPVARFQFLGRPNAGLPEWDDVLALLQAASETQTHAVEGWRRRWNNLQQARLRRHVRDHTSISTGRAGGRGQPASSPESVERTGPLKKALAATSRDEFVACLSELRHVRGISFGEIARRSTALPKSTAHWMVQPGNFPTHSWQVKDFVIACGANPAEASLWVKAWQESPLAVVATTDYSFDYRAEPHAEITWNRMAADQLIAQGEYHKATEHLKVAIDLLLGAGSHNQPSDRHPNPPEPIESAK